MNVRRHAPGTMLVGALVWSAAMLVFADPLLAREPKAVDRAVKREVVALVEKQKADMTRMSDQIWAYAETALKEIRSSKLLADYAQQQGFRVTRGVAGMPTAFLAEYGEGRPILAILGEYDALPGISQKATTQKEPLEAGAAGHGCGHNLFGVASLAAAAAVKELIAQGKLRGTIRFYGTPAEEAVGGKAYMIREGLFKDVDIALAWHPDDETKADVDSSQAMVDMAVEFHGKTAHAAFDPWNARSAVDAMELLTHGLNMLREHVKPTVRIHYTIQRGGDVPNVVPDYARLWLWVRDSKRAGVEEVLPRVRRMVEGAALMAGVEGNLIVQAGSWEMNANLAGSRVLDANLQWLGPIGFTEEEQQFARAIQRNTGVAEQGLKGQPAAWREPLASPPGGSTDVADVSWVVPTLHLNVTTGAAGAPWHAWPTVATGGMSIGHKGMMYAGKVLAATLVDLFEQAETRAAIRAEFAEKTKGVTYKGYILDDPPPVPKD